MVHGRFILPAGNTTIRGPATAGNAPNRQVTGKCGPKRYARHFRKLSHFAGAGGLGYFAL